MTYWLCALCTLYTVAACSDDGFDSGGESTAMPSGDGTYLMLRLNLARDNGIPAARSPLPGEDGDGREQGLFHENDIDNLCIFAYTAPDGVNAPASTPFFWTYYIDNVPFHPTEAQSTYRTDPVLMETFMLSENTRFLVVANMGDLTHKVSTLGQLRDYRVTKPWTGNAQFKDYAAFTMASERESQTVTSKNGVKLGSKEAPVEVSVPLERTAARIDFVLPAAVDECTENGLLCYKLLPSNGSTGPFAKVYLTHARIVNAMQRPTYLLKRTTRDLTGSERDYLGEETVGTDGVADNYVVEPTTLFKQENTPTDSLEAWFGTTRFALYRSSGKDASFWTGYPIHATAAEGTTGFDTGLSEYKINGSLHPYYVMGYTNENTMQPTCSNHLNATGLVVRAKYVPQQGYVFKSYDPATGSVEADTDFDFTDGQTFWRYAPSRKEMAEEKNYYFSTREAVDAYAKDHPDDAAVITEYTDGLCYYHIWLRHADNGDSPQIGPMEYGIVRNNIYQVLIKTISGPGAFVPYEFGPDHAKSVVYVRPWNVVCHPEIVI